MLLMIFALFKIYFFTWLIVYSILWISTENFPFFNAQAVLLPFVTKRDVITILQFKQRKLNYEQTYQALSNRNPDLAPWEIEALLLNKGENV
jgi:hypothetical protein